MSTPDFPLGPKQETLYDPEHQNDDLSKIEPPIMDDEDQSQARAKNPQLFGDAP